MKMNYPLVSRGDLARRRRRFWKIFFTLLSALLIYLFGSFLFGWLADPARVSFRPFWILGQGLFEGSSNLATFLSGPSKVASENEKLKLENESLRRNLVLMQGIAKDNKELRSIFGQSEEAEKPVLAQVIFTTETFPYSVLVVDLGSKNTRVPFKVGDFIVAENNVLIGRLAEISSYTSKAKLLSAHGEEVAVTIGENNIPATAMGKGSGNFEISLPKGAEVKVGDKVISPAHKNYLLGIVGAIRRSDADPFQTILFKTPVNLLELKWVEIYGA